MKGTLLKAILMCVLTLSIFVACEESTQPASQNDRVVPLQPVLPERDNSLNQMPQETAPQVLPVMEDIPVIIGGYRIDRATNEELEISWTYTPSSFPYGFTVTINDTKGLFVQSSVENTHNSYALGKNMSYAGRAIQVFSFNKTTLGGAHPSSIAKGAPYEIRITPKGNEINSRTFALNFDDVPVASLTGAILPTTCAYQNGVGGVGQSQNLIANLVNYGSVYDPSIDGPVPVGNTVQVPGAYAIPQTPQSMCAPTSPNYGCGVGGTYCQSVYANSNSAYGCNSCGAPYKPAGSSGKVASSEPVPMWKKLLVGVVSAGILVYAIKKSADLNLVENEDLGDEPEGKAAAASEKKVEIPYFLLNAGKSIDNKSGYIIVTPVASYKDQNNKLIKHSVLPYLKYSEVDQLVTNANPGSDQAESLAKEQKYLEGEIESLPYGYVGDEDVFANFKRVFSHPVLNFGFIVKEELIDEETKSKSFVFFESSRFNIVNPYFSIIADRSVDQVFTDSGKGIKQFYRFYADAVWKDQKPSSNKLDQYPKFDIFLGQTIEGKKPVIKAFMNCLGYNCASKQGI